MPHRPEILSAATKFYLSLLKVLSRATKFFTQVGVVRDVAAELGVRSVDCRQQLVPVRRRIAGRNAAHYRGTAAHGVVLLHTEGHIGYATSVVPHRSRTIISRRDPLLRLEQ